MSDEILGLIIAKDVAMWCETFEEFNLKLEEKIKLAYEIIEDDKII